MMQPHGGSVEGHHFPLRKDTEVMISFLGGDPDRPFIAGVVPNALKPSVIGSRNHTQNIIRTGAKNQIVMEDEEGKEFIFISTPNKATGIYMGVPTGPQGKVYTGEGEAGSMPYKDPSCANPNGDPDATEGVPVAFSQATDHNMGIYVGGDRHTEITGIDHTFVGGDVSYGYATTYELKVGGVTTENYYNNRDVTTSGTLSDHVVKKVTQTYDAGREQTVSGGDNTCHWNTSATFDGPKLKETFPETEVTASTSYKLTSNANTTISSTGITTTHLGAWTHDSAITKWTMGPVTWDAPSAALKIPNWENTSASWYTTAPMTGSFSVLNTAAAALCFQGYGLQMTICGVNIGGGGLNVSLYPFYLQNQGIHLGAKGVEGKAAGIWTLV